MSALHPNLAHQLRQWSHRVGQAAVPDDATLRGEAGDTLMTDSTATQPRTKGDELYAAGSTEITWVMVDLILAIALCVLLGTLVANSTWADVMDMVAVIGDTLAGLLL